MNNWFNSHHYRSETEFRKLLQATNGQDIHKVYLAIILSCISLMQGLPIKDLQKTLLEEIPGTEPKKRQQRSYIKKSAESLCSRLSQIGADKFPDINSAIDFLANQGVNNTFELRKWLGYIEQTLPDQDAPNQAWVMCSGCHSDIFKMDKNSGTVYCAKCQQATSLKYFF